jgi:hypothetical protein
MLSIRAIVLPRRKLDGPELVRSDYNLIVSLASVHHVYDKKHFFQRLVDHCAPGAALVIADVIQDTKVALFLDEFVGRRNGTGHDGWFLSEADPFDFGRGERRVFEVLLETVPVPWSFPDQAAMVRYCRLLFGMRGVEDKEILDGLVQHVGVETAADRCRLQWELTYITVSLD